MNSSETLDALFKEAVSAIDSGDIIRLKNILTECPQLVHQRLTAPGDWLRTQVGNALEDFFRHPYLLWFIAEDPVRNGTLPPNIGDVTRTIIAVARQEQVESLQMQLDYALKLVSWSWIARECNVQIELLDILLDAGANPFGNANNALVNDNTEAASHLVKRGDSLTLASALLLNRWDEVEHLAATATTQQKQFSYILASLKGKPKAVQFMLSLGLEVNTPSEDLYPHATALHHAVSSGSEETVQILIEAGADVTAQDTAFQATPMGWATHYLAQEQNEERKAAYTAIIATLTNSHD